MFARAVASRGPWRVAAAAAASAVSALQGPRWRPGEPTPLQRRRVAARAEPLRPRAGADAPPPLSARTAKGGVAVTAADVAKRDGHGKDGAIWVTYRDGVYDVTDYVKEHPGGQMILQGAGGPVDGFWAHWAHHHLSPKVGAALQRLRIGTLADYREDSDAEANLWGSLWEDEQHDPCRCRNHELTRRHCERPYASETKMTALDGCYFTPNEAFYVRNHAPVPQVGAADEHVVTFCAGEDEVASLTLAELRHQFRPLQLASVLQCSGNRGADNIAANGVEQSGFVDGPFEHIGAGLVGNALWRGVRLLDVLREFFPEQTRRAELVGGDGGLHVTFEGLDGYASSTPLSHVMDARNDCLLATHMNGRPLSPDHGFPLRAMMPGITGARQVKWVSRISVGPECSAAWNQNYYRDRETGAHLQQLPMNSIILSPEPGEMIGAGDTSVHVRGVAYGGGSGADIAGVEVSADRGKAWVPARCLFEERPADGDSRPHGWVRFQAELPLLAAGKGSGSLGCSLPLLEVWCRARSTSGEQQPPVSKARGGYFYNGYHRVPLVRR